MQKPVKRIRFWQKLRAAWRDTRILLGEFRIPLLIFIFLMISCGSSYYFLSLSTPDQLHSLAEGIYVVLSLTFFQPANAFPQAWYLQVFFFLMPIIGIGTLSVGLAEFSTLFFNRRARGKEWQMAVASTYSNHIVLIGLGHLGFRVVSRLCQMGDELIVVELNPKSDLLSGIEQLGVPIIEDDARRDVVLRAAGIDRARTVILCTQNDSLNLEIALKARALNPKIDVVVRIFDDEFAASLQKQFGFRALSATGMAAPVFAASALKVDMTPPLTIDGHPHVLARMEITSLSSLTGKTVVEIEEEYHASLVLLNRSGNSIFHPNGSLILDIGDSLAVFGTPEDIQKIIHVNRRA
jgi:voltage-gated potassium channel